MSLKGTYPILVSIETLFRPPNGRTLFPRGRHQMARGVGTHCIHSHLEETLDNAFSRFCRGFAPSYGLARCFG